ncbi:MAG: 4Fe-4S binding protein [Syntrophomonadaceae bacterium]|nr:4Fe-4S binding protein [Syntrophomonadaceae bacterium]
MKIAVLSGKGGTGKTLVSVNLAAVAESSRYIDCDVEEPNGHLFFKPQELQTHNEVTVMIPSFDADKCNGCRICTDFCKFNALALVNDKPLLFPQICHSCGGCSLLCPEKAVTLHPKPIGVIQEGVYRQVHVLTGIQNPGEPSGVPIIQRLLSIIPADNRINFIDCPPGSACVVIESIRDADYCILVAEPTLFGVHNLSMVHQLVRVFNKPFGAILNKNLDGENPAEYYCMEQRIPVLGRIPFNIELGRLNSDGQIAAHEKPEFHKLFTQLLNRVVQEVGHETIINP